MPTRSIICPECGAVVHKYRNPFPAVDIIIEMGDGIILIDRKNEPAGWALPGGFVDYGESLEDAARREAFEETSVTVSDLKLLGCYSDPERDSRRHIISTVFVATGHGIPRAEDDAKGLDVFKLDSLPETLCFDHALILKDYAVLKSHIRL
ncbi:MAG TPA: NUDIX hydrolase [Desulfuromonadales bacterium]|nr:NUDIX hydrolase [Desulfuromonadales bacterium]